MRIRSLLAPLAALAVVAWAGCATLELHPLGAVPLTAAPAAPVEVQTRSSGAADPVRLRGTRLGFAGLEAPLGHAVSTAIVPWAEAHALAIPGGLHLLVELTAAEARREGPRVQVTLGVRATLRGRGTHRYLAQTHARCHQVALVPPAAAAPVFYDCMSEIGRELAGWLGGLPHLETGALP
jgi:hypothetical protein